MRDEWGRATGPLRVLPDALVIGAMRAGTSSMYRYLGRHPQVLPAARKEIEYLGFRHDRGERWYRGHFPTRLRATRHRARHGQFLTFDASPSSMPHPRAAARARALLPDARLVAILRDPVERAWSHYRHLRRLGIEHDPFEVALRREEELLPGGVETLDTADGDTWSRLVGRNAYIGLGRYADQLARWRAAYPSDRLLVVFAEDLFADPAAVYARVVGFLGLDPWLPERFLNWSYREAPPSSEPLDPVVRERLRDRFAEDDRRLADLLGEPPPWRR